MSSANRAAKRAKAAKRKARVEARARAKKRKKMREKRYRQQARARGEIWVDSTSLPLFPSMRITDAEQQRIMARYEAYTRAMSYNWFPEPEEKYDWRTEGF